MHEGALSRAAHLLTSSGLAPDTDDTLQKLGKKQHPDPFESCYTPVATYSAAISLCHEVILKALKTTPRGSAPGPSGMQSVVSGNPPIEVGQPLAAARLIRLAKENGDVRSITVGECLRRLCARCISLQEKASMAAILAPVQDGVATSGEVGAGGSPDPSWPGVT